MPTGQEILDSVFGACRLALLDASGVRWFSVSVPGFWRSFTAALLVAPPFALIVALRFDPQARTIESFCLVESVTYVLGWTVFPLVMIPVSWALSLSGRYITYIIAYNWSGVVQVVVALPLVLLNASGLLPAVVIGVLGLLVTGALIFYQWFIARAALEAAPLAALVVVAVDLLTGMVIKFGIDRIL